MIFFIKNALRIFGVVTIFFEIFALKCDLFDYRTSLSLKRRLIITKMKPKTRSSKHRMQQYKRYFPIEFFSMILYEIFTWSLTLPELHQFLRSGDRAKHNSASANRFTKQDRDPFKESSIRPVEKVLIFFNQHNSLIQTRNHFRLFIILKIKRQLDYIW